MLRLKMLLKLEEKYIQSMKDNIRKLILNAGYTFEKRRSSLGTISYVPIDKSNKRKYFDLNLKVYKELEIGKAMGRFVLQKKFRWSRICSKWKY